MYNVEKYQVVQYSKVEGNLPGTSVTVTNLFRMTELLIVDSLGKYDLYVALFSNILEYHTYPLSLKNTA